MLYRSEPPTDRQRQRLRWIGAAVLAAAALLLLSLHARKQRHASETLSTAFDYLAAGELTAAETSFRRQLGDLSPEPLAILGLAVTQRLHDPGTRETAPTPAMATLDAPAAEHHAVRLLGQGQPEAALVFADEAQAVVGKSVALTRIRIFAAHWIRARKLRTSR